MKFNSDEEGADYLQGMGFSEEVAWVTATEVSSNLPKLINEIKSLLKASYKKGVSQERLDKTRETIVAS